MLMHNTKINILWHYARRHYACFYVVRSDSKSNKTCVNMPFLSSSHCKNIWRMFQCFGAAHSDSQQHELRAILFGCERKEREKWDHVRSSRHVWRKSGWLCTSARLYRFTNSCRPDEFMKWSLQPHCRTCLRKVQGALHTMRCLHRET